MPRVIQAPIKAGPGSAVGHGVQGRLRRVKKKAKSLAVLPTQQHKDEDLFAFDDQDERPPNNSNAVVISDKKESGTKRRFLESDSSTGSSSDSGSSDSSDKDSRDHDSDDIVEHKTTKNASSSSRYTLAPPNKKKSSPKKLATSSTNKMPQSSIGAAVAAVAALNNRKRPFVAIKTQIVARKKHTPAHLPPPVLTPQKNQKPGAKKSMPFGKAAMAAAAVPLTNARSSNKKSSASIVTIKKPAQPTLAASSTTASSEATTTAINDSNKNRWALAFDTRFIDTTEGTQMGNRIVRESHDFLQSLQSRGAQPNMVASTFRKGKTAARRSRRGTLVVEVSPWSEYVDELSSSSLAVEGGEDASAIGGNVGRLAPIWIAAPTNNSNQKNRNAVLTPTNLLANASWKHFGNMVESIIEQDFAKDANQGEPVNRRLPMDVTIVSSDLALFCDPKEEGHKRGLRRFWDLVRPFFHDLSLRTIRLVVIKTGAIALARTPENDTGSQSAARGTQQSCHADHRSGEIPATPGSDTDEESNKSDSMTKRQTEAGARSFHEAAIAKCVRALQNEIQAKTEADFKMNISSAEHTPLVDISVTMIDSAAHLRLGFKSLLRLCLREVSASLAARYSTPSLTADCNLPASINTRINLQLPETVDKTQCSLSLEVMYRTLPFTLNTGVTAGFFRDLQELSASKIDIVQKVPLATINASLLFGVPMSVRAALQNDYNQYQEMVVLVGSVLRKIQEEQVAILLRVSGQNDQTQGNSDSDSKRDDPNKTSSNTGVFHNPKRGQLFLLWAEEVHGRFPPSTGILYRYASADELLLEHDNPFMVSKVSVPNEVVETYDTYVEDAMGALPSGSMNPLFLDALNATVARPLAALEATHESEEPKEDTDSFPPSRGGVDGADTDDEDLINFDDDGEYAEGNSAKFMY